ncbi:MAG: hypothetical protein WCH65_01195 [bacterium]
MNYEKHNPLDVIIKESNIQEEKQIIETKANTFDKKPLRDIEKN